jgi:hypothetical protein
MNIGFHSNQLGMRGTEVAMYDYAHYNETILGNKSYIVSSKHNNLDAIEKFKDRFEVFLYDTFEEVEQFVQDKGIAVMYYIKSGENDGKLLKSCKNAIHAVFQTKDPHGDSYAYVAEWLSERMTGTKENCVPHIVTLPDVADSYRSHFRIPENAVVFGRYGGYDEFDIPWVQDTVYKVARENRNIYFLFMNTKGFCEPLPNIIHVEPTYDLIQKTGFINTCDAMLHARSRGETFGLSIAEFLHQDKPVLSNPSGIDGNHVQMLGSRGLWYNTPDELYKILTSFDRKKPEGYYKELVSKYTPEKVMESFKKFFINI